jgi:hypothetical protein
MMAAMSVWLTSVVVPVAVSVGASVVTQLSAGPRLAARGKRIQAANDWRDQFNDRVVDILALCGNLQAVRQSPDFDGQVGAKVQAERDRWVRQIDEITAWMVDHWQGFALTYLGAAGIRGLLTDYVMVARGVWLSGRDLDERVRLLKELTEPVQTIFFASRWRVVAVVGRERARLRGLLGRLADSDLPAGLAEAGAKAEPSDP